MLVPAPRLVLGVGLSRGAGVSENARENRSRDEAKSAATVAFMLQCGRDSKRGPEPQSRALGREYFVFQIDA
jgi:hypothetical protein